MFAASLLVVAVMATYASLAVISLTGAGTGSFSLTTLPGSVFNSFRKTVGWQAPPVKHFVNLQAPASGQGSPLADINSLFDFGVSKGVPKTLSLTNTSSTPLPLTLSVSNPAITANFAGGGTTMVVRPRHAATVELMSSPAHAGPISGTLTVAIQNSSSGAYTIQLTGAQAPYPISSLTATPIANGAVNLAWGPPASSGVTGYLLQRATGTGDAWTTVATLPATATSAVDRTPADGTYAYQVIALAGGATTSSAPVESSPGPSATAAADRTPPDSPSDLSPPPFIKMGTTDVGVTVTPGADSSPTDTITVTLTDAAGTSVSGQAPGGGSSVKVDVAGVDKLADGRISVSATAADSLGNTSQPTLGPDITKDTQAPNQPSVSAPPIVVANAGAVPVTVTTDAAGELVNVTMKDAAGNVAVGSDTETANETTIVIPVNAKALNDTTDGDPIIVTATATDLAGNVSDPGTTSTTKDATAPAPPGSIGVVGGPNNPPGVVTEASQGAVTVQATFDQPPSPDDQIVIWVAHKPYPVTADGESSVITVGPLDLSALSDGTYPMGIKEIDPSGNVTKKWGWHFVKDTGGAEAPTGVGVPAGPENPAGYVNAATQTAATIVATFAGPTDPADQISLSVGGMALSTQSGGDDEVSWTADLSSLPDGTLPITGTIIDANGVKSTFTGSLIKDTQAPPAPAVASVVGPPPNTITPSSASCVKVFVAFNEAPDPNDTVTVTLSDGSSSAQGSASAGNGHVIVSCIDAGSLSAGQISVSVTVTDVAGNSTDFTGTPAVLLGCHHGDDDDGGTQSPDQ
jgi:large repetitive protein